MTTVLFLQPQQRLRLQQQGMTMTTMILFVLTWSLGGRCVAAAATTRTTTTGAPVDTNVADDRSLASNWDHQASPFHGNSFLQVSASTSSSSSSSSMGILEVDDSAPLCRGKPLDFELCLEFPPQTTTRQLDVFFLLDDSAGFRHDYLAFLQHVFPYLLAELHHTLLGGGVSLGVGVGRFSDYGGPGRDFSGGENWHGRPFVLNQPVITADDVGAASFHDVILEALKRTSAGFGADGPETALEALYQVATGAGLDANGDGLTTGLGPQPQNAGDWGTQVAPDASGDVPSFDTLRQPFSSGSVGGVGFRPGARKLVILATDICPVAAFTLPNIPFLVSGRFASREPTLDLACPVHLEGLPETSTTNRRRLGFVSNALSLANDTLFPEDDGHILSIPVAPRGSHTVPETIDALTEAGIFVVGWTPDGQPQPSGSGPTREANTFLSALARLTGAVHPITGVPLLVDLPSNAMSLNETKPQSLSLPQLEIIQSMVETTVKIANLPVDVQIRVATSASEEMAENQDEERQTTVPNPPSQLSVHGMLPNGRSGPPLTTESSTLMELKGLSAGTQICVSLQVEFSHFRPLANPEEAWIQLRDVDLDLTLDALAITVNCSAATNIPTMEESIAPSESPSSVSMTPSDVPSLSPTAPTAQPENDAGSSDSLSLQSLRENNNNGDSKTATTPTLEDAREQDPVLENEDEEELEDAAVAGAVVPPEPSSTTTTTTTTSRPYGVAFLAGLTVFSALGSVMVIKHFQGRRRRQQVTPPQHRQLHPFQEPSAYLV